MKNSMNKSVYLHNFIFSNIDLHFCACYNSVNKSVYLHKIISEVQS